MLRRLGAIVSLDVAGYTAMMEADPDATLQALHHVLADVVRPAVRRGGGRIVKLMGDGALVEFSTAAEAILTVHRILAGLREDPVRLRAGVHVGDVSIENGDVFGDAVNVAARLQALARPGGGLVSRTTVELAGGALKIALKPEGALRLKGHARPVEALSFDLDAGGRAAAIARLEAAQTIRFATSKDGTRLAWAAVGEGPVLIKAPNWITHLEHDWSTVVAGWIADLAGRHRLIRFDQRANGLSDRDVADVSLERFVDDLEAVFDAGGIERAPVICLSQGAAIGAAFAARRPERVSGLVALGSFRQGPLVRTEPRHVELTQALDEMGRVGWDDVFPSVRDHFARVLVPDASPEDQRVLAEVMHATITALDFARFREAVGRIDVTGILPEVRCPALVMHATGDRMHPIEQGRSFAAAMPNGRFVTLDSRNHLMLDYDPAWPRALAEIEAFLAGLD